MSVERLMDLARELNEMDLAEVIDFAERLRSKSDFADETDLDGALAEIDADPIAKARFDRLIQEGLDAIERGEVIDGEAAMARLRDKFIKRGR